MVEAIGGYLCQLVIVGGVLVFAVIKIIGAADDGGEVKKTAKDGFAECFRKLFK